MSEDLSITKSLSIKRHILAGMRINFWFSEKNKPWFKDKGLMSFLYQELTHIDVERDVLENKCHRGCRCPDCGTSLIDFRT